jgi:hypothetical protein
MVKVERLSKGISERVSVVNRGHVGRSTTAEEVKFGSGWFGVDWRPQSRARRV